MEASATLGLSLERLPDGCSRDPFLPLLALADDSPQQLRSYDEQGDLFVLRAADGSAEGVALVIPTARAAVEIKALAVRAERQRRGLGRLMLALVFDRLRRAGVHHVVVGTATSSIGAIAFYQRVGFRFSSVERDFFTAERGYAPGSEENGIPLRDMIWMDQWL